MARDPWVECLGSEKHIGLRQSQGMKEPEEKHVLWVLGIWVQARETG